MQSRDKIIRFYKGTSGEEIVGKILDTAEIANKTRKYRITDFMDPYGAEIAEVVSAHFPELQVAFDGGYFGAERQCAIFIHEDFTAEPIVPLNVIKATWNEKFARLSHRDVLGAITGLGIDRNQIGDLLVSLGQVKIICTAKIAPFLLNNLQYIGSTSVSCCEDTLDSIAPKEERCKEITSTAASMRLDAIAAIGYSTSRSKMAAVIEADRVKVNWQPAKSSSQMLKEGDIISIRGRGRVEIVSVNGKSKKGRTIVTLKRYI